MINALKNMVRYLIHSEEISNEENYIYRITPGGVTRVEQIDGVSVSFENKGNMIIVFGEKNIFINCKIECKKNDYVVINESQHQINNLRISSLREGTFTWIGENFSCSQANINLKGKKSVWIGNDCMFSNGISILTSDMHAILDKNGKLVNADKDVYIGNHVWIGQGATILKGAKIADNSVVGASSLVTKQYEESNVIIAGNPAKIIKHDITWNRKSPELFQN